MAFRKSIPEILAEVAATRKLTEKVQILRENESNPLKSVLAHTYHPDIKFALPEGVPPYNDSAEPDGLTPGNLFNEFKKFYIFVEGGHSQLKQTRREYLFIQMLEVLSSEEAKVVLQMVSKKPFKGLTYNTVHESFPGIIPFKMEEQEKDGAVNEGPSDLVQKREAKKAATAKKKAVAKPKPIVKKSVTATNKKPRKTRAKKVNNATANTTV